MSSNEDDKAGEPAAATDAADTDKPAPTSRRLEHHLIAPHQVKIDLMSGPRSLPPPLPEKAKAEVAVSLPPTPAVEALPASITAHGTPAPGSGARWAVGAIVALLGAAALGLLLRFELLPEQARDMAARLAAPLKGSSNAAPVLVLPPDVTSSANPTRCVVASFPDQTFRASEDLSFVCTETEAWALAQKLQKAIVANGATTGARLWENLGMYDLAAAATLHRRCCTIVSQLSAPVPSTQCGALDQSLSELGAEPDAEALARYEQTVRCLIERKVRLPPHFIQAPEKPMRDAVAEFFGKETSGSTTAAPSSSVPAKTAPPDL